MKLKVVIVIILTSYILQSQNTTKRFYADSGRIFVSIGAMYNQPILSSNRTEYIRFKFIPDIHIDVGYMFSKKATHGWLFLMGASTKNYNFSLKNNNGSYGLISFGLDYYYFHVSLRKSYNFNISKKTNALIAAGPVMLMNQRSRFSDSLKLVNEELEINDRRGFGVALNLSVSLVSSRKRNKYMFVTFSYQRGFINFMEISIYNYDHSVRRNFLYSGTGPAVKVGVTF